MNDDHLHLLVAGAPVLVRAGVAAMLAPHADRVEVAFDTGPAELADAAEVADVVLIHLDQGGALGRSCLTLLRGDVPAVALFPVGDARSARVARTGGFVGCLDHSAGVDDFLRVLTGAAAGRGWCERQAHVIRGEALPSELSKREREVLGLVAHGLSNAQICRELFLGLNTVKTYVRTAYRKIGVTSRSQAVAWAIEHRCVTPLRGTTADGRRERADTPTG